MALVEHIRPRRADHPRTIEFEPIRLTTVAASGFAPAFRAKGFSNIVARDQRTCCKVSSRRLHRPNCGGPLDLSPCSKRRALRSPPHLFPCSWFRLAVLGFLILPISPFGLGRARGIPPVIPVPLACVYPAGATTGVAVRLSEPFLFANALDSPLWRRSLSLPHGMEYGSLGCAFYCLSSDTRNSFRFGLERTPGSEHGRHRVQRRFLVFSCPPATRGRAFRWLLLLLGGSNHGKGIWYPPVSGAEDLRLPFRVIRHHGRSWSLCRTEGGEKKERCATLGLRHLRLRSPDGTRASIVLHGTGKIEAGNCWMGKSDMRICGEKLTVIRAVRVTRMMEKFAITMKRSKVARCGLSPGCHGLGGLLWLWCFATPRLVGRVSSGINAHDTLDHSIKPSQSPSAGRNT